MNVNHFDLCYNIVSIIMFTVYIIYNCGGVLWRTVIYIVNTWRDIYWCGQQCALLRG